MSSYLIRGYLGSDPELEGDIRNMIYAFFKKSLIDGNDWYRDIDEPTYHQTYTLLIDNLLARENTIVKLAVLPDATDICLGFSICEGPTLHYVFVKTGIAARDHGIGTALLPDGFNQFTHLTKIGRSIWKKKYPNAKFNPFA